MDRKCRSCGMKLKQHVSFSEANGRITIKVWRYKCPFCDSLIEKPAVAEVKYAIRKKSAATV